MKAILVKHKNIHSKHKLTNFQILLPDTTSDSKEDAWVFTRGKLNFTYKLYSRAFTRGDFRCNGRRFLILQIQVAFLALRKNR